MTVHKLSAGDGYTYYTREVASGDELRATNRDLGDYYHLSGYPPGQWGGRGAAHLEVSGEVTEAQMQLLYGEGLHPRFGETSDRTGKPFEQKLGQRYKRFTQKDNTLHHRIATALGDFERLQHHAPGVDERRIIRAKVGARYFRELHGRNPVSREELGRFISQQMHPAAQAVAGFDLVFSPPKSVSYLWGVGGENTRLLIERAHLEAVESTMRYLEDTAVYTRRGKNGVLQQDVAGGLIYTRFRHYDARDGDPQLHDHVVVSNKVLGTDEQWGTLDGALLYQFNVAASEHYNRCVMENVCNALGVATSERQVPGKRPVTEIAGIDVRAIDAASSRRGQIQSALRLLVDRFRSEHGYEPNRKQMISLSQQATLTTRADKKHGKPLAELVADWQHKFGDTLGLPTGDEALQQAQRASAALGIGASGISFDLSADEMQGLAAQVVQRIESERAVWGEHHVQAEATRQLGALAGPRRLPDTMVFALTRTVLEDHSLCVTPDLPVPQPVAGAMMAIHKYQKAKRKLYTSHTVLRSESNLLEAAQRTIIPVASHDQFTRCLSAYEGRLDEGQRALAEEFTCSDRLLKIGIGPAGAGKTTAMRLVVDAARASGGRVLAVAPTAAAAAALGREIGSDAMTLDAFVLGANEPTEHFVPLKPGDMLLLDEAGMVGTGLFAQAVDLAADHGAVIRAIGDDRQLGAIGCGGALRLIDQYEPAVRLETVHRFRHPDGTPNEDEAAASLSLRQAPLTGTDDPWTYYWEHRRIMAGDTDLMEHRVFAGWQKDQNAGLHALMIAPSNALVGSLNDRAQAYRLQLGELHPGTGTRLQNGARAYVGDVVVSRRNDRRLPVNRGHDFVKNNDVWTVTGIRADGSLDVQHRDHHGTTTLPAEYVRNHVDLGYASTIHRAQGMTYDSSHSLLAASLDRAQAYVATSRGRYGNKIYVALEAGEHAPGVLARIAANTAGNLTAHDTATAERLRARSLEHLGAVYRDLVDQARDQRLRTLFAAHLDTEEAHRYFRSPVWDAVAHHLGTAENRGLEVHRLIQDALDVGEIESAHDRSAVMAWRLERLMESRERLLAEARRPLKDIPAGHLRHLRDLALARHHGILNEPAALATAGAKPWRHRLYGHLGDDELAARITRTEDERDRQIPSDPENKTQELEWALDRLHQERSLRQTLPDDVHRAETFQRERTARIHGADIIVERINDELQLRSLVEQREHETPRDLPEWFAPTAHVWKPETPAAWATQIRQYRDVVKREFTRVGAELAENPPPWLHDLGPVPRRADRHREWRDLAAEVAAYRHTYNIPDSEPGLVPKEHRDNPLAKDFRTRATALHKHSSLTTKPPLTPGERTVERIEAELAAAPNAVPTAAEAAIAELRRRRHERNHPVQPATEDAGNEPVAAPAPATNPGGDAGEPTLRERLERLQETRTPKVRKARRGEDPGTGPDAEGPRLG
ncbi:MobF family relaxase [Paeniglutamicibacter sp. NPDC012692]|uniref:MobF family relaxase n=1 Tax=Paeniglutamicibacter sp. NPDC012692 TaxID=3364388 RepID=UPI0036D12FCD